MFFVFISKNIKSENTVEYITEGSDTTDIKSFKLVRNIRTAEKFFI